MSRPGPEDISRPLRIGIDGREMEGHPTGVGRYLRSLLRRFASHDRHQFVVYSAAPVTLPVESERVTLRVLSRSHPLVWEQRRLPAAFREDRIDVALSPAYSCPLLASVPRVTAIHDLSFFARPKEFNFAHRFRRQLLARASARVSSALLACSRFTKAEIGRCLGSAALARTEVVLLGPDDDLPGSPDRAASRSALGLGAGVHYVVTVGTVLRRRHVDTLARAVTRLRTGRPGLTLGIVGENRTHPFMDLTALAASLGAGASIRLTGFVSDGEIARHYAAADAAVFLSDYEGFGLPALEAMSRGLPTLIADRDSLRELFGPGTLVVEPEETAVATALANVLDDPSLASDLKRRGRECAKRFSWDRAASEILAVLEDAAS